jgi:hypothetical protein
MADQDNKEIIQVIFENDQEAIKGPNKDENLSAPGEKKDDEVKPGGSNKSKLSQQVAQTVVARTIRGSALTIMSKYAEYTNDYTMQHNLKASMNMVGIGQSIATAAMTGNYLDLLKSGFDMILSMADFQMQKDKLQLQSERTRKNAGLAEFQYGRYGSRGKRL